MSKSVLSFLKVFCVLIFLLGCSTEDSGGGTDKPPLNPISVHPFEAVTIELSSSIGADEYQGNLGGESVQLVKLDDTHLMFMVPSDMAEGIANLTVSSLGLDIPYDVSHVDLEGSPQEVLGQLLADVEVQIQGLEEYPGAAYASDYLAEFENSFNNASEAEQRKVALLYQVNSQLIHNILTGSLEQGDYSTSSARSSNKQSSTASLSNLAKFKLYVLAAGASAATAVLAPVDPFSKGLLAAVAVVASVKALKYHDKLAKTELTKLNVLINDLRSALKQQEEKLEFTHDTSRELNLRIEQRTFNSSDEGDSNENVSSFFSAHKSLSGIIQKINNVIDFVNDKLFLSDMDNMENAVLNESQPSVASVDASLYENFSFSVASNKVEISEITYDNGLKINFNIKDVENLSQDYIDTQLEYSYSDDFNDFSGSFDIRVKKEQEFNYEGTWLLSFYYDESRNQKAWEYKIEMDANGNTVSIYSRNYERWHEQWSEWTDYSSTTTFTMVYDLNTSQLKLIADNLNNVIYYFNVDSLEQTDFDVVNNTSYEGGRLEKL